MWWIFIARIIIEQNRGFESGRTNLFRAFLWAAFILYVTLTRKFIVHNNQFSFEDDLFEAALPRLLDWNHGLWFIVCIMPPVIFHNFLVSIVDTAIPFKSQVGSRELRSQVILMIGHFPILMHLWSWYWIM